MKTILVGMFVAILCYTFIPRDESGHVPILIMVALVVIATVFASMFEDKK